MDQQNLSQMHAQLGETLDSKSLVGLHRLCLCPPQKDCRNEIILNNNKFYFWKRQIRAENIETRMSDEEGGGTTGWLLGVVRKWVT